MKRRIRLIKNSKESFLFYVSRFPQCLTKNHKLKTGNCSFNLLETVNRKLITVLLLLFAVILFMVLPVWAGMNQWTSIGPGGGNVNALAIDPMNTSIVYAGTDSGSVYKSTNGGGNWSPVNTGLTNLNVDALSIDPANTSIVYAGTNGSVYKSTDGGTNWNATCFGGVNALAIDPANTSTVYAGMWGLSKSTDGGVNCTDVNSISVTALAIDPANTSTVLQKHAMAGYTKAQMEERTGMQSIQYLIVQIAL